MMSGLAAMTGTRERPQRVGSSANDIMGGMFGVISILAALYQKRGGNNNGADIRIGLFENCLFLVAQHMVEYEMTGRKPRSMPEREHAWPIYDIFETEGGDRIFIGVVTEGHWHSFCREFGLSEFADDPTLRNTTDRILARARIIPRVAEEIRRWDVGGTVGETRCAEHLLLADQPARGSPAGSACAAARRARAKCQCRRQAVPRSGLAGGVERRQYRRGLEGAGARRRHRSSPRRTRAKKIIFNRKRCVRPAMTRVQDIYPDNKVTLREVGLRDGLQLVKKFPSTSAKQRWVRDEYAAGVRHFEVGSFLPAKTFPQFVDVRDDHCDHSLAARRAMASR